MSSIWQKKKVLDILESPEYVSKDKRKAKGLIMSVMLTRYILGHWHNLPTVTPSLACGECIWNPLALKPGGAILGKRERETTWWPTQGSLNNLQILIRYCDTAEQKIRLKINQTWLLCRFTRWHIEREEYWGRRKQSVEGLALSRLQESELWLLPFVVLSQQSFLAWGNRQHSQCHPG